MWLIDPSKQNFLFLKPVEFTIKSPFEKSTKEKVKNIHNVIDTKSENKLKTYANLKHTKKPKKHLIL